MKTYFRIKRKWMQYFNLITINLYLWYSINLLKPSDAYMQQWTGSSQAQIMVCQLCGTKAISETMIISTQLDTSCQMLTNSELQLKYFHSWPYIWLCWPEKCQLYWCSLKMLSLHCFWYQLWDAYLTRSTCWTQWSPSLGRYWLQYWGNYILFLGFMDYCGKYTEP